LLKREIFGKKQISELKEKDISMLLELTRDIVGVIKSEVSTVNFWESYPKQKRLKSYIINNFLLPKRREYPILWEKRKEIAHKILELAYHIYGGTGDGRYQD